MHRRTVPLLAVLALSVGLLMLLAAAPAGAHTLGYKKARATAQRVGDTYARKATTVNVMVRRSRHRYYAQARWDQVDQIVCQRCAYDPVTDTYQDTTTPHLRHCWIEISIRFRSPSHSRRNHRVVTTITGHGC